jgi:hypothetical protein
LSGRRAIGALRQVLPGWIAGDSTLTALMPYRHAAIGPRFRRASGCRTPEGGAHLDRAICRTSPGCRPRDHNPQN